jgi:hypothetical protein
MICENGLLSFSERINTAATSFIVVHIMDIGIDFPVRERLGYDSGRCH